MRLEIVRLNQKLEILEREVQEYNLEIEINFSIILFKKELSLHSSNKLFIEIKFYFFILYISTIYL